MKRLPHFAHALLTEQTVSVCTFQLVNKRLSHLVRALLAKKTACFHIATYRTKMPPLCTRQLGRKDFTHAHANFKAKVAPLCPCQQRRKESLTLHMPNRKKTLSHFEHPNFIGRTSPFGICQHKWKTTHFLICQRGSKECPTFAIACLEEKKNI